MLLGDFNARTSTHKDFISKDKNDFINNTNENCIGPPNRQSFNNTIIMWTQLAGRFPEPQGWTWLPDHFVPLIGNDQIPSSHTPSRSMWTFLPRISPSHQQVANATWMMSLDRSAVEDTLSPVIESKKISSTTATMPPDLFVLDNSSLFSDSNGERQGESEDISVPVSDLTPRD